MNLKIATDIAETVLRNHSQAHPKDLANLIKKAWDKKGVLAPLSQAAKQAGKLATNASSMSDMVKDFDSGLLGVYLGVSGKGNGYISPGMTLVAFISIGANGQGSRFCIGTRGGVTVKPDGSGADGAGNLGAL